MIFQLAFNKYLECQMLRLDPLQSPEVGSFEKEATPRFQEVI